MYVLISLHPHEGTVFEVEIFEDRPRTVPFEPSNWPRRYRIYEGDPNGGDTILVEEYDHRICPSFGPIQYDGGYTTRISDRSH